MALMFIRAVSLKGTRLDLFVHAKTPEQAVDEWKLHYSEARDPPSAVKVYTLCGATCGVGGTIPWAHIPHQEVTL